MKHELSGGFQNVVISPIAEEHIEALRVWRNHPENSRFLQKIPYITPEMQQEWFQKYLNNADEIGFAISENLVLNRCVGSVSLYHFTEDTAEFGKFLIGDPQAHGKGIGYHTVVAVLYVAFEKLALERVELNVYAANLSALHIYKKAGFQICDSHFRDNREEYTMIMDREGFHKLKVVYAGAGR